MPLCRCGSEPMDEDYSKETAEIHRHIDWNNVARRIASHHTASQRTFATNRIAPYRSRAKEGKRKVRKIKEKTKVNQRKAKATQTTTTQRKAKRGNAKQSHAKHIKRTRTQNNRRSETRLTASWVSMLIGMFLNLHVDDDATLTCIFMMIQCQTFRTMQFQTARWWCHNLNGRHVTSTSKLMRMQPESERACSHGLKMKIADDQIQSAYWWWCKLNLNVHFDAISSCTQMTRWASPARWWWCTCKLRFYYQREAWNWFHH